MNAIKIMGIALVLLLILNFVSLGMLWKMSSPENGRPPRPSEAADFLMRELQFNEVQRKHYHGLIMQHRKQMRRLEFSRIKSRNKLFAGIATGDTSQLNALRQLQGETELLTFRHFQAVRKLGTPEQQTRFDQIIQEVLRKMSPRRPHPRRLPKH